MNSSLAIIILNFFISGAAFLEAFLIGFEVECKIAEAIDPNHYNRGFHSSGTICTFGAAAAAAKLLKLNDVQLSHMLAIAASTSSGIRVNPGRCAQLPARPRNFPGTIEAYR